MAPVREVPRVTPPDQVGQTAQPPVTLPAVTQDVRRKRPPFLSFLLKLDTLRQAGRVVSLLALDFAGLFGALLAALSLKALILDDWDFAGQVDEAMENVPFAYLVTVLLFARSGLYSSRGERPGLTAVVAGLVQVTIVAFLYAVISGQDFQSYYLFYGSLAFAVIIVSGLRFVYERVTGRVLRAAGYQRRAVLVGTGEYIEGVAHALDAGNSPVNVVGFVALKPRPDNGLISLGDLGELGTIIDDHRIDEVIIADPDFPQEKAVDLVDTCHQRGVRVKIAPSTMEILMQQAEFVPGEAVPLFELRPPVFDGFDYVVKRTFDLIGSALILLVLSPALIGMALAVRLTSRGPVFYRSVRPGIGGRPFGCLKFRTMYEDADERQAELEHLNEASGALFKMRQDPRTTPIGRLLRRHSLDELPQLINVLKGQMSLVGPRPLPMRDYERLEDWHRKRYLVLPGITGLWQVSGRSDLEFDDLVKLDFLYLERWSVYLDFVILLKTLPAVLTRRGAF
ncbi:MAG: sugar transferase [Solirubrobacteraceae bacterium]|nr:sugar transferase [Solirubrobacteraceae bacterium]